MALFNEKTIRKHINNLNGIPSDHLQIIEQWIAQIKNGTLAKLNEIEVHASFTSQIMCKLLGYSAMGESDNYTIAREYPVARGHVDLALGYFCGDKSKESAIAPFELKGAKTKNLDAMMSGRHKTPVQQAFEYARDMKGAKWVLLSNYLELRLYAVSETSLVYERFYFEDLLKEDEYAKFQLLLNKEPFLSGKTESLLKESESADKDICDKLYEDYKHLRQNTLHYLIEDNPDYQPEDLIAPAQKLLDRILFVSFAEDKGLIPETSIKSAFDHNDPYNPRPIYQNFIGLFNAIDKGNQSLDIPAYNGGLFALDSELDSLTVSNELCEGFKNLAEYDFDSEVSVTVLGHIFEQSIADLEELTEAIQNGDLELLKPKPKAKAVSGKRKKHGVVYTPDNITQFIVVNTLGVYIDEQFEILFSEYGQYKSDGTIQWKRGKQTELRFWYGWQEKLQKIKVVDPACGSGAFLVAAFDYLHIEYEKINNHIEELTGQRGILELNKEILNNNLFGVDINEESIEITKLSLWLKTAERGKPLESLNSNFVAGNSLGFEQPAPESDFCWKVTFKPIFDNGGFDVVLGNPPYVRQELLGDLKPWLEENYEVYHGVLDLYGYFFELGNKLLKTNGRISYISNATFFKTGSGENLRKYLSTKVQLEKIIDFGDVQVFEGVTTYPAIIVSKKHSITKDSKIEILKIVDSIPGNLEQTFVQQHALMKQSQLSENSWQLVDEQLYALRGKLTNTYPTLKQSYGSPYRGVLTGLNEAFVINKNVREKIIKSDPLSSEIIFPFMEGKDLKRWHCQPREIFLIFTRRGINIDKYPGVKKHLESFKERLSPKPKDWPKGIKWPGRKSGPYKWYEIQDTVGYHKEFEKNKIQYGHFCPEPLFHYNTNSAYSNDKSYILPTDDLYLYGLLNSSTYWYLIKSMCPFVRGGFYEVRAQYIETLPVPEKTGDETISILAENTQLKTESRYKCENDFRRRLVDLCPEEQVFKINKKLNNWWELDFKELQKEIKKSFKGVISLAERNDWQDYFESEKPKRESLNNEVTQLQTQLDQEVYELFNLTQYEIMLIKDAVS